MDEPLRDRLRAARPGGMTSPDPVTALHGQTAPHLAPTPKTKARTRRRTRERQENHVPRNRQDHYQGPAYQKPASKFTRWIQA